MLRRRRYRLCQSALVGILAAAAFAMAASVTPAAAEGLFEFLFGGLRRLPRPAINFGRPDDAFRSLFNDRRRHPRETLRSPAGPRAAYCVRLCDGRYFPIQARHNFSAAEQCNSFCPATTTKIFAGSAIEYATAADGQRYADLPNAFIYRQRIVPGCSCDSKDRVGIAHVPVTEDPTLRPGDIVATDGGFTVYNGRDPQRQAAFTPIESAKVSASLRNRLAGVEIVPRQPQANGESISIARSAARETTGIAPADETAVSARVQ